MKRKQSRRKRKVKKNKIQIGMHTLYFYIAKYCNYFCSLFIHIHTYYILRFYYTVIIEQIIRRLQVPYVLLSKIKRIKKTEKRANGKTKLVRRRLNIVVNARRDVKRAQQISNDCRS